MKRKQFHHGNCVCIICLQGETDGEGRDFCLDVDCGLFKRTKETIQMIAHSLVGGVVEFCLVFGIIAQNADVKFSGQISTTSGFFAFCSKSQTQPSCRLNEVSEILSLQIIFGLEYYFCQPVPS